LKSEDKPPTEEQANEAPDELVPVDEKSALE
jgi:hypothetical protein